MTFPSRVAALALLAALLPAAPALAQEPEREPYVVRSGDTLWEIAERVLGDPGRWRDIYRLNRDAVADPGRLRPGQRLRLPADARTGDAGRRGEAARSGAPDREAGDAIAGASLFERERSGEGGLGSFGVESALAPRPVSESDVYGAPYLVSDPAEVGVVGRAAGDPDAVAEGDRLRQDLDPGGRVVVVLESSRVAPGETLAAVKIRRGVYGDRTEVRPVAILHVLRVEGNRAVAGIGRTFDLFRPGQPVVRVGTLEVPRSREWRPDEDGIGAEVIGVGSEAPLVRLNGHVYLDAGSSAGVRPGDEFALLARGTAPGDAAAGRLAVVRVVRVTPETSTARVVGIRRGRVPPGSAARLVRRLAPEEGG